MTRISIITPSLNQGRFLREALESVRTQHSVDVEHLVLDGGSTDSSVDLLKSLSARSDWPHLRWVSGPDGGQSDALNRGFAQATGDIVGWLNADDRYRPDCFRRILEAFEAHPEADAIYGDFAMLDEQGAVQSIRREIDFNAFVLLHHRFSCIPTCSTFFRRRIFAEGHRLKTELHYAMDYEFFLRLDAAGYRIRHTPGLLADFRVHSASKSCRMAAVQAQEKQRIMHSFSPVSRLRSRPLRKLLFAGLQVVAGTLRYAEKLRRGIYFMPSVEQTPASRTTAPAKDSPCES
jgi:glycosyltransferase involved in cell wall biosynthesis